jgi:hypothetical protein
LNSDYVCNHTHRHTHTHTHTNSVGFLLTSDQLFAEAATYTKQKSELKRRSTLLAGLEPTIAAIEQPHTKSNKYVTVRS